MTSSRRSAAITVAIVAGLAVVAFLSVTRALSSWPWPTPPANELTLYGNVDIRQVDLAFQDFGRL